MKTNLIFVEKKWESHLRRMASNGNKLSNEKSMQLYHSMRGRTFFMLSKKIFNLKGDQQSDSYKYGLKLLQYAIYHFLCSKQDTPNDRLQLYGAIQALFFRFNNNADSATPVYKWFEGKNLVNKNLLILKRYVLGFARNKLYAIKNSETASIRLKFVSKGIISLTEFLVKKVGAIDNPIDPYLTLAKKAINYLQNSARHNKLKMSSDISKKGLLRVYFKSVRYIPASTVFINNQKNISSTPTPESLEDLIALNSKLREYINRLAHIMEPSEFRKSPLMDFYLKCNEQVIDMSDQCLDLSREENLELSQLGSELLQENEKVQQENEKLRQENKQLRITGKKREREEDSSQNFDQDHPSKITKNGNGSSSRQTSSKSNTFFGQKRENSGKNHQQSSTGYGSNRNNGL